MACGLSGCVLLGLRLAGLWGGERPGLEAGDKARVGLRQVPPILDGLNVNLDGLMAGPPLDMLDMLDSS